MAENLPEVLAGAAVIAVAAGFFVFASQGTGFAPEPDSYPLTASFRSVEGVTVGTDVRLAGVKVGTVTALTLNPQTFFADAIVSVRRDVVLPDDSSILISSEGLLGGSFVELQPGGSPSNIEPGGEIEDTQGAVSIVTLLMKFAGGGGGGTATDAAP
ncbi:MAG: outer membrane lipid asymmetry maintenance protein MlaD [Paracoccaceae bacterium]